MAHLPAMCDEVEVEGPVQFLRDEPFEQDVRLFPRRVLWNQPQPPGDAMNVGIDRESRRPNENNKTMAAVLGPTPLSFVSHWRASSNGSVSRKASDSSPRSCVICRSAA